MYIQPEQNPLVEVSRPGGGHLPRVQRVNVGVSLNTELSLIDGKTCWNVCPYCLVIHWGEKGVGGCSVCVCVCVGGCSVCVLQCNDHHTPHL